MSKKKLKFTKTLNSAQGKKQLFYVILCSALLLWGTKFINTPLLLLSVNAVTSGLKEENICKVKIKPNFSSKRYTAT